MNKYVVYRVYSKDERPRDERVVYYGWSTSKFVIKAFLSQRDNNKYKVEKVDTNEDELIADMIDDPERMIDYIKLRFASDLSEMYLFTTMAENKENEIKIQSWFHSLSSLEDYKRMIPYLSIYQNLDPYYRDALELIGFRPKEIDCIYTCSDERDNLNPLILVSEEIDDAYSGMIVHPADTSDRYLEPPGLITITDSISKCIYSVEAFIMVMKGDL